MDLGADAIKIGMVGSPQNVAAISDALVDFTGPIILDPVMIATSGARLGSDETTAALISLLVPRAHVVTPNIPEAEYLAGIKIETRADMLNAAQIILAQGPKAVLVKGGHLPGDEVADLLFDAFGAQWFEDRKINTRHTHGTGCTLASAIASNLGQGRSLQDAVIRSRAYVRGAIETAPGLGQGHGPLNHLFPVRD
jgi:hydroxymethylpyrimidine/phosphomethylpyrimidine kinase